MREASSVKSIATAAALVLGCAALPASGQAPMPKLQMQGGIVFLNGGAGDEEVQYLRQQMKDFTLALVFARGGRPRVDYAASAAVTIMDAKGVTVLDASSVGPYLLVALPAGKYSVVASYLDVTQTRPVTVAKPPANLQTFIFK